MNERCRGEECADRSEIRLGEPESRDVQALSDWSAELQILEACHGKQNFLTCDPVVIDSGCLPLVSLQNPAAG